MKQFTVLLTVLIALVLLCACNQNSAPATPDGIDTTAGDTTAAPGGDKPGTPEPYYQGTALLAKDGTAQFTLTCDKSINSVGMTFKKFFTESGIAVDIVANDSAERKAPVVYLSVDPSMQADSYSISVDENGIVIAAPDKKTVGYGVAAFKSLFSEYLKEGTCEIPCERLAISRPILPRLPDKTETTEFTGPYDNLLIAFGDEEATAFDTYCTTVEGYGYRLYDRREEAGNLFATYTCESHSLCFWYTPYNKTLTVDADPTSALMPLENETYEKITEPSMTQTYYDFEAGNWGMCYIFTLEDGSFFLVDSGNNQTTKEGGKESTRLYNLLCQLNKREDGEIIIRGWFLTHGHGDHVEAFKTFATQYGRDVTLERLFYHMPRTRMDCNLYSDSLSGYLDAFRDDTELIAIHPGQRARFCNMDLTFLFTSDLYLGESVANVNNYSTVMRVSYGGQTILINGDISRQGADVLCPMYQDALKCDIIQVAHHGYYKVDENASYDYYTYADPTLVLWPHNDYCYNDWKTSEVNTHLLNDLHVERVFTSHDTATVFPLPFPLQAEPTYITASSLPQ